MELIAEIFIRSWFGSAVLHIGAGLRYGCLRLAVPSWEESVISANPLWFGGFQ